jgi:transcriptional regulator
MYLPRHFAANDVAVLHELMRANPLATLVTGGDAIDANHIPLLLVPAAEGKLTVLHGHVARANPLAQAAGGPVLAIFHGPDAYVSPSWYPGKAADGRVVPTWNYAVVHARGTLRAIDDCAWLRSHIDALTAAHEAAFAEPWAVADAPDDYIERMADAIVGIEIVVERLEGKLKLSQNRSAADRRGVIEGLRGTGQGKAALLARWMG